MISNKILQYLELATRALILAFTSKKERKRSFSKQERECSRLVLGNGGRGLAAPRRRSHGRRPEISSIAARHLLRARDRHEAQASAS